MLLLSAPSVLYSKEMISIYILPFENHKPASRETALMFQEVIRTHIINSRVIKIAEDSKQVSQRKVSGKKELIAIGDKLDVDFILRGSLGIVKEENILSITLFNRYTERSELGENFTVRDKNPRKDLKKIADTIINKIKNFTDVTIPDIRAYIDCSDWENALININIYQKRNPGKNSKLISSFEKTASSNLAQSKYSESRKFLENYLFEKALSSINSAISLQPYNKRYKNYRNYIKKKWEAHSYNTQSIMLETVRELIKSGKITAAEDILKDIEKISPGRKEVVRYRIIIKRENDALSHYSNAKKYYRDKNYIAANIEIRSALKLKPGEKEFLHLKSRIRNKMEQEKKVKKSIAIFYSSYDKLNPYTLFADKKNPRHHENISYISNIYKTLESPAFTSGTRKKSRYALGGIELSEFYHNTFPRVKMPVNLMDLNYTIIGSVTFSGLTREKSDYLTGIENLFTTKLFTADASVSIGPSILIMSYLFGIGVDLSTGYLRIKNERTALSGNSTEATTENFLKAGIGYSFWFSWLPFDNIQIFIRWKKQATALMGGGDNRQDNTFSTISVGAGFRLF